MPRALITGITGQDGLYLAELLAAKGYDVVGLVHGVDNPRADLVRATIPSIQLIAGDLTDFAGLVRAMRVARPDEVYNLAAMSFVARSWEQAAATADVTAKGVLNLLEAIRLYAGDDLAATRFYQASSSEMFGAGEAAQTETTRLWPRSPYGVAKAFGHHLTINYRESYGMHASSGILFNHESPRRGAQFVTRKITKAVAAIDRGLQDQLVLGNLDIRRDWGFAGDYVEAMWRMLQQPVGDDFVVATGRAHSIRDLLDIAFGVVGIDDWTRFVRQDPTLLRPADISVVVGDASRAREVLGWQPRVGFTDLVTMMVEADLRLLER